MADDTHICGVCKCEFHSLDDFINHKKICRRPCHTGNSSVREETFMTSLATKYNPVINMNVNVSEKIDAIHEVTEGPSEINLNENTGQASTSVANLIQFMPVVRGGTSTTPHQQQLLPVILMPSMDKSMSTVQKVLAEKPTEPSTSASLLKGTTQETGNTQIMLLEAPKSSYEVETLFTSDGLGVITLDEQNQVIEMEKVVVDIPNKPTPSGGEHPIDLSGPAPEDHSRLQSEQVINQEEILKLANSSVLDTIDSLDHERIVVPENALDDTVDKKPVIVTSLSPKSQAAKHQEIEALARQAKLASRNSVLVARRYCCKRCNLSFSFKKDLIRHVRIHTGAKPFACSFCDKKFARTDKRKIHERIHTGEKPYKCTSCSYASTDSTNLKKHIMIHSGERPFSCQICDYTCRNSNQLTLHIRTHTGDAPYACYICGFSFKIKSDLTRHMRIHSGEKPFKCNFCDYRCSIKSNLKSHEKINHDFSNILPCQYCDFKTSSRKNLTIHMSTVHDFTGAEVKCSHCEFSTKDKLLLKRHLKKTHNLSSHFSCDLCSFTTEKKGLLNKHIRRKHQRILSSEPTEPNTKDQKSVLREKSRKRLNTPALCQKKFKCTKCEATFARKNSLSCHLRNHDDTEKIMAMAVLDLQKPFVCKSETMVTNQISSAMMDDVSSPISHIPVESRSMLQHTPDSAYKPSTSVDLLMKPSSVDCAIRAVKNVPSHSGILHSVCSSSNSLTVGQTIATMSSSTKASGQNDMGPCVPSKSSTKSKQASPQFSTSFLTQAANNLLAFMQNNQNRAVEDNMNNMARDLALNSALNVSNSTQANSSMQTNGYALSQNVVGTGLNLPAAQHLPQISVSSTTLSTQCSGLGQTRNRLNSGISGRDTHNSTVLGNNTLIPQVVSNQGQIISAENTAITTGYSVHVPHSRMLHGNQPRSSSGQSSWEQLQEAVLQHSVNLQSGVDSDSQTHQFDRDISSSIHTEDMSMISSESAGMLPANLSELEPSRSDFIVMS